jgi:hypothetical protein
VESCGQHIVVHISVANLHVTSVIHWLLTVLWDYSYTP